MDISDFDIQRFADSITPTSGNDIIYNKNGDYSYIDADAGDDYIFGLDNDYVTIHGNTGDDTILGSFYHSEIYGDNGDDYISVVSNNDSNSIYGDAGNDTIHAFAGYVDGGDGSDTIILLSSLPLTTTVVGGTGNDTIYGYRSTDQSSVLYQYTLGDGNDLIYNYKPNDTISVGNSWSTVVVDENSVVFSGINTITTATTGSDSLIANSWYLDTIKNGSRVVSVTANNVYIKSGDDSSTSVQGVDLNFYKDIFQFTVKKKFVLVDVTETLSTGATETSTEFAETISPAITGTHAIVHVTDSYGSSETCNILLWNSGNMKINLNQSGNFIVNNVPNAVISVPSGNTNIDSDLTYSLTAANDIINNNGNNSYINAGSGDDSINNNNAAVTVTGGNGNDTISGTYLTSSISGGTGNDYIVIGGGNDSNSAEGGTGNDTIIATGGLISGDDGNDVISLTGSAASTVIGGTGNDIIHGNSDATVGVLYKYFFGDGNDTIFNYNSNDTLSIEHPTNSSTALTWATMASGNNIVVNILNSGLITLYNAQDKTLNISPSGSSTYIVNSGINSTIAGSITSSAMLASSADFYSDQTALAVKGNFSSDIWLSGNPFTGATDAYTNSKTVTIDASQQTADSIILAGNDNDNVIIAGSGNTSLWGGSGGNDTLTGGVGRDMFWFGAGGGNDVVNNFNAGTYSNSDVVNIVGDLYAMKRNNANLYLEMLDGSSFNINFNDSSVDKAVQYSTDATNIISAKLGNDTGGDVLTYDSSVDYYFGGGGVNTLNVEGNDDVEIWLDSDKYYGIQNINAGNAGGNVLMAGDFVDNVIASGGGNASLWGGFGGNDTLIGGAGRDVFWYGLNNGNDVIQNSEDGDVINLFDMYLSDLVGASKSGSDLIIATRFGDNLTVTGNSTATFKLADGSGWKYDHVGNGWTEA